MVDKGYCSCEYINDPSCRDTKRLRESEQSRMVDPDLEDQQYNLCQAPIHTTCSKRAELLGVQAGDR